MKNIMKPVVGTLYIFVTAPFVITGFVLGAIKTGFIIGFGLAETFDEWLSSND